MDKYKLVTGGSGFLGSYIVKELLRRGDKVRVLDIKEPESEITGRIDFIKADIRDCQSVRMPVSVWG